MDEKRKSHVERLLDGHKKPTLCEVAEFLERDFHEFLPPVQGQEAESTRQLFYAGFTKILELLGDAILIRELETSNDLVSKGVDSRARINEIIEEVKFIHAALGENEVNVNNIYGFALMQLDILREMLEVARDCTEVEINKLRR